MLFISLEFIEKSIVQIGSNKKNRNKEFNSIFDVRRLTDFKPLSSLLSFCPHVVKLTLKPWEPPLVLIGNSNHRQEPLFWPHIPLITIKPQASLLFLLPKPFLDQLHVLPQTSQKSHYVSNKPFHSLLVCMWHYLIDIQI